jgi:hypothetical protein
VSGAWLLLCRFGFRAFGMPRARVCQTAGLCFDGVIRYDFHLWGGCCANIASRRFDFCRERDGSLPNQVSQKILSLTETQRNAVWTQLATGSGERCDRVIRTMFQGGIDQSTWSVGCRDGNEYTVTTDSDTSGSTNWMTCKECFAANVILSKGKPDPKMRCWVKW